jgi:hypothetical protein
MRVKMCFNCGRTHGPLKRYYWNTHTLKGNIASSHYDWLCEKCAKPLGAWQQRIQEGDEYITIGTPEEAERVAMSLTDEDIERLEREENYSSLN